MSTPLDKYVFSAVEMRDAFSYDPSTGAIARAKDSANGQGKTGDLASRIGKCGRVFLHHQGKKLSAGRVAWVVYHGKWPEACIDHVNGNPLDNRIENLREATHAENMRNRKTHAHSSTGVKGVSRRQSGKFRASIAFGGVLHRIGLFDSISEASAAYEKAAIAMHGEFNSCTSRAA